MIHIGMSPRLMLSKKLLTYQKMLKHLFINYVITIINQIVNLCLKFMTRLLKPVKK